MATFLPSANAILTDLQVSITNKALLAPDTPKGTSKMAEENLRLTDWTLV